MQKSRLLINPKSASFDLSLNTSRLFILLSTAYTKMDYSYACSDHTGISGS